jgi:hypothetical protein
LLSPEFKTAANEAAIAGAWNYYRGGHIDVDQVRDYIKDLAGGIKTT